MSNTHQAFPADTPPMNLDEEAAAMFPFLDDYNKQFVFNLRRRLRSVPAEIATLINWRERLAQRNISEDSDVNDVLLIWGDTRDKIPGYEKLDDDMHHNFRIDDQDGLHSRPARRFLGDMDYEGPQEHVSFLMTHNLTFHAKELSKECEDWLTVAARGRGIIGAGAKLDESAIRQLWFHARQQATMVRPKSRGEWAPDKRLEQIEFARRPAQPRWGWKGEAVPDNVASLTEWFAKRASWVKEYLLTYNYGGIADLSDELIAEMAKLYAGAPSDSAARQKWAKEHQLVYTQHMVAVVHAQLDELGIHGYPTRVKMPEADEHWFTNENDYLSRLLGFLRAQADDRPNQADSKDVPLDPSTIATGQGMLAHIDSLATSNTVMRQMIVDLGARHAGEAAPGILQSEPRAAVNPAGKKPKRSTERGEGRTKLIAALTRHHQYSDDSCLNLEPIGNNELAKAAGVSNSTASTFFNDKFQGHTKYKAICRDAGKLAAYLKLLNDEFAPYHLLGAASSELAAADEEDTDGE